MPIRLSQNDAMWKKHKLGTTTLGREGCLVTGICIGHSKFFPYHVTRAPYLRPSELADALKSCLNGDNEIIWQPANEVFRQYGMEMILRDYSYTNYDKRRVQGYCKSPEHFVLLEVLTREGQRHWIYCMGRSVLGWATMDTWDGKMLWKTVGYGGTYLYVRGYAVFRKYDKLKKMTNKNCTSLIG